MEDNGDKEESKITANPLTNTKSKQQEP
jgi:hypothetical protein